jgi:hypothetical protein
MTGPKEHDRWKPLCEAIAQEPDSRRLMELVEMLIRVLKEEEGVRENGKRNLADRSTT